MAVTECGSSQDLCKLTGYHELLCLGCLCKRCDLGNQHTDETCKSGGKLKNRSKLELLKSEKCGGGRESNAGESSSAKFESQQNNNGETLPLKNLNNSKDVLLLNIDNSTVETDTEVVEKNSQIKDTIEINCEEKTQLKGQGGRAENTETDVVIKPVTSTESISWLDTGSVTMNSTSNSTTENNITQMEVKREYVSLEKSDAGCTGNTQTLAYRTVESGVSGDLREAEKPPEIDLTCHEGLIENEKCHDSKEVGENSSNKKMESKKSHNIKKEVGKNLPNQEISKKYIDIKSEGGNNSSEECIRTGYLGNEANIQPETLTQTDTLNNRDVNIEVHKENEASNRDVCLPAKNVELPDNLETLYKEIKENKLKNEQLQILLQKEITQKEEAQRELMIKVRKVQILETKCENLNMVMMKTKTDNLQNKEEIKQLTNRVKVLEKGNRYTLELEKELAQSKRTLDMLEKNRKLERDAKEAEILKLKKIINDYKTQLEDKKGSIPLLHDHPYSNQYQTGAQQNHSYSASQIEARPIPTIYSKPPLIQTSTDIPRGPLEPGVFGDVRPDSLAITNNKNWASTSKAEKRGLSEFIGTDDLNRPSVEKKLKYSTPSDTRNPQLDTGNISSENLSERVVLEKQKIRSVQSDQTAKIVSGNRSSENLSERVVLEKQKLKSIQSDQTAKIVSGEGQTATTFPHPPQTKDIPLSQQQISEVKDILNNVHKTTSNLNTTCTEPVEKTKIETIIKSLVKEDIELSYWKSRESSRWEMPMPPKNSVLIMDEIKMSLETSDTSDTSSQKPQESSKTNIDGNNKVSNTVDSKLSNSSPNTEDSSKRTLNSSPNTVDSCKKTQDSSVNNIEGNDKVPNSVDSSKKPSNSPETNIDGDKDSDLGVMKIGSAEKRPKISLSEYRRRSTGINDFPSQTQNGCDNSLDMETDLERKLCMSSGNKATKRLSYRLDSPAPQFANASLHTQSTEFPGGSRTGLGNLGITNNNKLDENRKEFAVKEETMSKIDSHTELKDPHEIPVSLEELKTIILLILKANQVMGNKLHDSKTALDILENDRLRINNLLEDNENELTQAEMIKREQKNILKEVQRELEEKEIELENVRERLTDFEMNEQVSIREKERMIEMMEQSRSEVQEADKLFEELNSEKCLLVEELGNAVKVIDMQKKLIQKLKVNLCEEQEWGNDAAVLANSLIDNIVDFEDKEKDMEEALGIQEQIIKTLKNGVENGEEAILRQSLEEKRSELNENLALIDEQKETIKELETQSKQAIKKIVQAENNLVEEKAKNANLEEALRAKEQCIKTRKEKVPKKSIVEKRKQVHENFNSLKEMFAMYEDESIEDEENIYDGIDLAEKIADTENNQVEKIKITNMAETLREKDQLIKTPKDDTEKVIEKLKKSLEEKTKQINENVSIITELREKIKKLETVAENVNNGKVLTNSLQGKILNIETNLAKEEAKNVDMIEKLRTKEEIIKTLMEDMEKVSEKLQISLGEKTKEVNEKVSIIKELQEKISKYESKESVVGKGNDDTSLVNSLQVKIVDVENSLVEEKAKNQSMLEALRGKELIIKTLKGDTEKLNISIEEKTKRINDINENFTLYQNKIRELETESKQSIAELEKVQEKLGQKHETEKQQILIINEKEKIVSSLKEKLEQKCESEKQQILIINEKEELVSSLRDELSAERTQKTEMEKQHIQIINEKEALEKRHTRIINEKEELVSLLNDELSAEKNKLPDIKISPKGIVTSKWRDITKLRETVEELRNIRDVDELKLATKDQNIATLEKENKVLGEKLARTEGELLKVTKTKDELKAREEGNKTDWKTDLNALQDKLDETINSKTSLGEKLANIQAGRCLLREKLKLGDIDNKVQFNLDQEIASVTKLVKKIEEDKQQAIATSKLVVQSRKKTMKTIAKRVTRGTLKKNQNIKEIDSQSFKDMGGQSFKEIDSQSFKEMGVQTNLSLQEIKAQLENTSEIQESLIKERKVSESFSKQLEEAHNRNYVLAAGLKQEYQETCDTLEHQMNIFSWVVQAYKNKRDRLDQLFDLSDKQTDKQNDQESDKEKPTDDASSPDQ